MNCIFILSVLFFFLKSITEAREHIPIFKSGVRHLMNVYEKPKQPFKLHLSAWELNLVNDILTDIMMSTCDSIYAEEANNLKTYVSSQIAEAPMTASLNPQFLDIYVNLIKCREISEEQSTRRESIPTPTPTENVHVDFKPAFNINENVISENDLVEESEVQKPDENKDITSKISLDKTTEITGASKIAAKVKVTTTVAPSSITSSKSEQSNNNTGGVLEAVGHLISKLYEKTVSIFSWFSRKKRNVEQLEHEDKQSLRKTKRVISTHRNRYYKDGSIKTTRHNIKKLNHRKLNKVSSSVRSSKMHFLEIFNSMTQIATSVCPTQLKPMVGFVNEAIHEILWYINEDLDNAAAKRLKLDIDVELQQRVSKCFKNN